jgi:cell division protein FtsN
MKWHKLGREDRAGDSITRTRAAQRGNFVVGMIVGLLLGLAIALAVALWVTKVPVPFVNKVPQRTSDAAEAERNKNWDPNAPLAGKSQPTRSAGATGAAPGPQGAPAAMPPPSAAALPPYVPPVPPPLGGSTTAGHVPARPPAVVAANTPSPTTAPAAAPATKPAAPASSDPFVYFVQAGAYTKPDDAEQQRARLAMLGFTAKVTEREQVGRTMYRVRVGPFDAKDGAESAQEKLRQSGVDAALVRVERSAPAATTR